MQWEMSTDDNKDFMDARLTVDGEHLATVFVNYQTIGWQESISAWDYCRMPSPTHNEFPDVWSAMEAAETAVSEAITDYQRHGPWEPDRADLAKTVNARNEWLSNEGK